MRNLSIERVVRLAGGGAVAGFLTFLILNPGCVRVEQGLVAVNSITDALRRGFISSLILGMVLCISIGAALIAADEVRNFNAARLCKLVLLGAVIGAVCGAIGGCIGQFVFLIFILFSRVIGRAIGWCLIGMAAGVCPGAATGSLVRIRQGVIGGVIGGTLGGLLFDALAIGATNGTTSRAVGFLLIGIAIGAAVALVEELAKESWITVLSGAKEGRSYILSKPEVTIGRNELADIPLFGDASVQKLHARVRKNDVYTEIIANPGLNISVNSLPVSSASLKNGDIIGIGSHRLKFCSSQTFAPQTRQQYPPNSGYAQYQQPGNGYSGVKQSAMPAMPTIPTCLTAVSGPHAGERFLLNAGFLTIGRDVGCQILLARDSMASRQHAAITFDGASLKITDCASTNGLFVNGCRVSERILTLGDQVGVGQSVLVVQ